FNDRPARAWISSKYGFARRSHSTCKIGIPSTMPICSAGTAAGAAALGEDLRACDRGDGAAGEADFGGSAPPSVTADTTTAAAKRIAKPSGRRGRRWTGRRWTGRITNTGALEMVRVRAEEKFRPPADGSREVWGAEAS